MDESTRKGKKKSSGKETNREVDSDTLKIEAPTSIMSQTLASGSRSKTTASPTANNGAMDKPFAGPRRKSVIKNTILIDAPEGDNDDSPRIPPTRAPPNFLGSGKDRSGSTASGKLHRKSRTPVTGGATAENKRGVTFDTNQPHFQNIGYASLDIAFNEDEIERLARRFVVLDQDNSGTLDIAEFMAIPELQQNNLAERIIRLFDKDKNGVVDFKEFIDGVSVFSTKSDKESKMKFAFRVYDMDNDGYISNADLFEALTMMVGDTIKDVHLQEIVNRTILNADFDEDGKISYPEFSEYIGIRSVVTSSYSRLHIEI